MRVFIMTTTTTTRTSKRATINDVENATCDSTRIYHTKIDQYERKERVSERERERKKKL